LSTSKVNLPLSLLDNNDAVGLWLSVNIGVRTVYMGWYIQRWWYISIHIKAFHIFIYIYIHTHRDTTLACEWVKGGQVRASQRSIIPRYYTVSPGNQSPVTMVTAIYSPATRTHYGSGQVHSSADLFFTRPRERCRYRTSFPLQLSRDHSTWSSLPISLFSFHHSSTRNNLPSSLPRTHKYIYIYIQGLVFYFLIISLPFWLFV